MYIKENLNPKNRKTGDCVIRAIAKAEGIPWVDVFDRLVNIARKLYSTPNDSDTYNKYLANYQKVSVFHEVDGKKKRYTVKEIANTMKGTYLVSVAGHMVAVVDGNYYDIWDCGQKCAYVIWKVR